MLIYDTGKPSSLAIKKQEVFFVLLMNGNQGYY